MADGRFVTVLVTVVLYALAEATRFEQTELRMPGVEPNRGELYLCHAMKLDSDSEHNIVEFIPRASMHTAHHMLLFGCSMPGSNKKVWDCGEMHKDDEDASDYEIAPVCMDRSSIIYAWAKDAPQFHLPEGVGFRVGGSTRVQYLVLQVHYMHPLERPDYSGITLYSSTIPMPKTAGVVLMATDGHIKAKSTEKFETACLVNESLTLHPFAFRVHTHKLGKVVSGYVIHNKQWKLIGRESPQKPQMFYPVQSANLVVQPGDMVAARCTMENPTENAVSIGTTGDDEMCNFYMMYWVEGTKIMADNMCWSPGPPGYYWGKTGGLENIPDAEASSLPVKG